MTYFKATGISIKNEVESIKKKKDAALHPVFEALANSFEAVRERFGAAVAENGEITVTSRLVKKDTLFREQDPEYEFASIEIADNGTGITDIGYERIRTLRDSGKSTKNKGTGRVQFVHFFDETHIESCFRRDGEQSLRKRDLVLSKKDAFASQNALLGIEIEDAACDDEECGTKITFLKALSEKDEQFYLETDEKELKKQIIRHFLALMCDWRSNLPRIGIRRIIDGEIAGETSITAADVPVPDSEDTVLVRYSKMDEARRQVVDVDETAEFDIRSFRISASELQRNEIFLVSKGETAKGIGLEDIKADEVIDNNRYLFLLSGDYIDAHDTDTRGNINLIRERELKKAEPDLFDEPVILQERLESAANAKIRELCVEIKTKKQEQDEHLERLRKLFLLNRETVEAIKGKIKTSDDDVSILQKIYAADSCLVARKDAEIKKQLESIESLRPEDEGYQEALEEKAKNLVTIVPLQNRNALSQYVARRKIVLELFNKILERELVRFRNGERIDEKVLHNLIFQQHSEDPKSSDLWLINEEYIYFSGASEERFEEITYNGEKIISRELTDEDKRYLESLGERRLHKRPDVLLFPDEGKCLIIEFKAPDVNVAEHLSQIDFYANILLNYTSASLGFTRFYGCLIGEGIEDRDVRGRVSGFIHAPESDYWYRPDTPVVSFERGRPEGCIYTEVIKYTALLKRAMRRNQIFIEKLGLNPDNL